MKKQVLIATGLAVLSTSAFASKARLEALGQNDDRGSFYVEDSRNIFRNAAKVNTFKNYITTEWGDAAATDSASTPQAEGGFFREMGSFNYGVYMGSDIDAQNSSRTNYQVHDNGLDLFFGGDMGVQWGARVHYASGNTENAGTFKKEHSNFGLGLGMMMGDIEGYANIILSDESKGGAAAADKFEANGLNLGVSYNLNGNKLFVDYDADGFDNTVSGAKTEQSNTAITVGVGRIHEVSSTARLNMDLKFVSEKEETKTAASTTEDKYTALPLTIGFEADATSWLTLRGSVSQNIIINNEETKTTTTNKNTKANTTDVTAGATLNFGKLKVDGSIGTTSHARNAATQTENGTLALDNVLTRVGVTYWF
ncbi:hypothetical protein BIY24_14045 [Halobacteriovorax marinus]|uniref:hypothetical protein n=1 Tax=Halobacteriovorax marinus TaxID=97084 RepID=UPI000BC32C80|nr:hypothetical protein [Halobacteriovorax marinus]ATH09026.1 hypothetical protein BIY24_14045 [Halobacteriovorax marinus]